MKGCDRLGSRRDDQDSALPRSAAPLKVEVDAGVADCVAGFRAPPERGPVEGCRFAILDAFPFIIPRSPGARVSGEMIFPEERRFEIPFFFPDLFFRLIS